MFKIFVVFTLLATFLSSAAVAAPIRIGGQALNGTTGKPLVGATIQLVKPKDKGKRDVLGTAVTGRTGRFSFPPREYGPTELLMANVNHGNFDYWSVAWDGGQKLKEVGITVVPGQVDILVFDTTKQPVPLDFQVHHVAIEATDKGLKCVERIVVDNHGKKTLLGVGPRNISVMFNLPKGAKNVRLDPKVEGASLVETSSGWGLVKPVTPENYGVRNAVIINYEMEWPSQLPWAKKIDLSRETVYPTKFFFVARTTADKDLQISSPILGKDQDAPVPIDGKQETRIINAVGGNATEPAPPLDAGKAVGIVVSRPVSGIFWGFAGLTVAICLFFPLALIRPKGSTTSNRVKSSEPSALGSVLVQSSSQEGPEFTINLPINSFGTGFALNDSSRELIQKIADLDDLREMGGVDDDAYQNQRAALKKQLLESFGSVPN